jgi:hypothetical protein
MGWLKQMRNQLRACLIMALLLGIVLIDSISRVISMCVDGFIAVLIFLLIWPLIRNR